MTMVKKRDGALEGLDIDKIHKVVKWAIEDIAGVSLSEIEMNAKLSFFDGIETGSIHDLLVDSAVSMIDDEPNYSKVAARLLLYKLRKQVWRGKNPPKLYDLVCKNIERGVYDPSLLELYPEDDFHKFDEMIDHERDDIFEYAGLQQLVDKYLVQDRGERRVYETPQFAYMLVAMVLFANEGNGARRRLVRDAYNAFSKHKINLATPIMAGARTRTRSFASCCLISVDDSKDSLFSSNTAAGLATCNKYGIGLDLSKVRAINAPIKNGETLHTGIVPWLKMFQATIHSCQQGGARRGAGTVTFPIFHYEIEDIVQLKDNTRTEENSVRHLDYSIAMSRLFWERYLKDEKITLFSSHEAREVYDKHGTEEFEEVYLKHEKRKGLKFRKEVSARDLIHMLVKQRVGTGRIYIVNVDEANKYCAWDSPGNPVQMANLCLSYDSELDVLIDGSHEARVKLGELGGLLDQERDIRVRSHNLEKDVEEYDKIERFLQTSESEEVLEIEDLHSGFKLKCTADHEIFTENRGFVKASDLLETDSLKISVSPSKHRSVNDLYDEIS